MTSHAAVVARGMGKCCVSGAGDLHDRLQEPARSPSAPRPIKEGDWISLNGSTGVIYEGKVATKDAEVSGDFAKLMELADEYRAPEGACERRHAARRADRIPLRRAGYRSVPYRTHVLRRRPHQGRARDDPRRRRSRPPRGAGQAAADAARRLRRAVRSDERPSRHGPPARPAVARIRSARREGPCAKWQRR